MTSGKSIDDYRVGSCQISQCVRVAFTVYVSFFGGKISGVLWCLMRGAKLLVESCTVSEICVAGLLCYTIYSQRETKACF